MPPLHGLELINENNYMEMGMNIPIVTPGKFNYCM